ncbi:hypothetical protein KIPB_004474 [Kipferlia bialata]|uniref:Uncharacterized protein n=1 Tax=Kipferlia bialata TaxID=797122 RepID=A0A9K3CV52_9EUKA|nr:hypothetical protein KIPB_004474 [Kipferlia bialata]|eukprot:g4474.t1
MLSAAHQSQADAVGARFSEALAMAASLRQDASTPTRPVDTTTNASSASGITPVVMSVSHLCSLFMEAVPMAIQDWTLSASISAASGSVSHVKVPPSLPAQVSETAMDQCLAVVSGVLDSAGERDQAEGEGGLTESQGERDLSRLDILAGFCALLAARYSSAATSDQIVLRTLLSLADTIETLSMAIPNKGERGGEGESEYVPLLPVTMACIAIAIPSLLGRLRTDDPFRERERIADAEYVSDLDDDIDGEGEREKDGPVCGRVIPAVVAALSGVLEQVGAASGASGASGASRTSESSNSPNQDPTHHTLSLLCAHAVLRILSLPVAAGLSALTAVDPLVSLYAAVFAAVSAAVGTPLRPEIGAILLRVLSLQVSLRCLLRVPNFLREALSLCVGLCCVPSPDPCLIPLVSAAKGFVGTVLLCDSFVPAKDREGQTGRQEVERLLGAIETGGETLQREAQRGFSEYLRRYNIPSDMAVLSFRVMGPMTDKIVQVTSDIPVLKYS